MADEVEEARYCVHEYKVWPEFYEAIVAGRKTFEARLHDRQEHKPNVGCILRLQEVAVTGVKTGNVVDRRVAYRLDGGEPPCAYLPSNFFIVGFDVITAMDRLKTEVTRLRAEVERKDEAMTLMSEVIEAAETEPLNGEYAPDFLRLIWQYLDFNGGGPMADRLRGYADNLEQKRDEWLRKKAVLSPKQGGGQDRRDR